MQANRTALADPRPLTRSEPKLELVAPINGSAFGRWNVRNDHLNDLVDGVEDLLGLIGDELELCENSEQGREQLETLAGGLERWHLWLQLHTSPRSQGR